MGDARDNILDRIAEWAEDPAQAYNRADAILKLAEAYAWITSPAQPHGGSAEPAK
jgi:hypothetical protein